MEKKSPSHKAMDVACGIAMDIIADTNSQLPAGSVKVIAYAVDKIMDDMIERCALVVEGQDLEETRARIVAAVRALKERT